MGRVIRGPQWERQSDRDLKQASGSRCCWSLVLSLKSQAGLEVQKKIVVVAITSRKRRSEGRVSSKRSRHDGEMECAVT